MHKTVIFSNKIIQAYYRGVYGPDYVWITPMWYNTNWWIRYAAASGNKSCSNDIIIQVLDGSIGTLRDGFLLMENNKQKTFSGLV